MSTPALTQRSDKSKAARGRRWGYPEAMTGSEPQAASTDWAKAAEDRLLDAAIDLAPDTGWTDRTIRLAAARAELGEADAKLLLPNGASDLVALLWRRQDARAFASLAEVDPRSLKIRD